MDIWDYFHRKQREFDDYSAVPDLSFDAMMQAEAGSGDLRGIVKGNVGLGANSFLSVYERVVLDGDDDPRAAYCYTLVIQELHVHRWENDPHNHPEAPIHEHVGPDETRRVNTGRVSLRKVLERAWEEISLQAEAPFDP